MSPIDPKLRQREAITYGTVVHMTSVHRPDDPRIFHKECRTLARAGYDVHLIAPNAARDVRAGVRTWGVRPPRSGNRLARMTSTVSQVFRRARWLGPALYHFHDPELIPAALLLARSGAPVVYDVHEDLVATLEDKPWVRPRLRDPAARLTARFEPAAADRLAAVVTATPVIRARFARCTCHLVTVTNYPILAEFQDAHRARSDDEPAVCYVGGLDLIRGIDTMIEAIAKTEARLLLAGHFDPPRLVERLRLLPGWSRVTSSGVVGRPEVAEIFGRAQAGLVVLKPLDRYVRSQPTKLFEYMAAGLPVIASDFPLWREIIDSNACGICVDPLNSDDVAQAIRWIITHPEQARQMGENGRRAVHARYNWETEGRKLVALYGAVLADWAGKPARTGFGSHRSLLER